ncbi:MAG: CHAD domain-containing protein [Verrucomicrobiota bacterium]|jgi:CHAD domain-containing protein
MSYRIEKNEALSDALGRIAAEEIALALAELRRPNRAQAMHNTRKSLKRLRDLLRSLRVAFPKNFFRRENRRLAAAGREIAPLRDVHVQLRTLGRLRAATGPVAQETRQSLRRRQDDYMRNIPALRRAVRQMLSASRQTLASWPMKKATPARLAAGLKRIYKQGRTALKAARQKGTPESLHEWRKQAKTLGHGLALIERLGPKKAGAMIERTEQLCQALGDDHDLFLVLQALRQEDAAHPARDYRRLSNRIAAKRARLQKHAFRLGRRIFDEKPGAFARRLEGWLCRKPPKK